MVAREGSVTTCPISLTHSLRFLQLEGDFGPYFFLPTALNSKDVFKESMGTILERKDLENDCF